MSSSIDHVHPSKPSRRVSSALITATYLFHAFLVQVQILFLYIIALWHDFDVEDVVDMPFAVMLQEMVVLLLRIDPPVHAADDKLLHLVPPLRRMMMISATSIDDPEQSATYLI